MYNKSRIFNHNGTLVQPNNYETGPFGIKEERFKTKNRNGEEIQTTRIRRSRENLSEFTKKGFENKKTVKKLSLSNILSQNERLDLLYSDDDPDTDELLCKIIEYRNNSIKKILDKCENRLGNIDFKKYKLNHNELDEYAIPIKDIEAVQQKPTSNEVNQYLYGWGVCIIMVEYRNLKNPDLAISKFAEDRAELINNEIENIIFKALKGSYEDIYAKEDQPLYYKSNQ
jgi:hypothetical protein